MSGIGFKLPQAAFVKSKGCERCGKLGKKKKPSEVRIRKTNKSESLIKRRKEQEFTSKPMTVIFVGINLSVLT